MSVQPLRVLLVEDDAEAAVLAQRILERDESQRFVIEHYACLKSALASLNGTPYDIALLDLSLPDSDGPDTVQALRAAAPELPIVVVSGTAERATVFDALERGAQDYLLKGRSLNDLLVRSITYTIESQRRETALRHNENKYRELANSLPQVVFELDPGGRVTFANRHAFAEFGYTDADFENGLHAMEMMAPNDRERAMQALTQTLAGQDVGAVELTALRKDGSTFPVMVYVNRLARDGVPYGVTGIIVDLTERRSLEAQFLQAQKMEVVGRLAGGVAHDFNNLLTVINGYANVVAETLESNQPIEADREQIQSHVGQILRAGRKAEDITRKLLTFSGRQRLHPQFVDLNTAIFDMDKMLRRFIGEDIELVFLPQEDLGTVHVDPAQMEQAMINLIVNARDAMPQGGTITIRTANQNVTRAIMDGHDPVHPGDYVVISIQDTGTGMTSDVLAHAFEPFFSTKETGKGTGLGLATVYGIVKEACGNILTQSAPGRGTTFSIYLPRRKEAPASSHTSPETTPVQGGHETVLVVEDERSVRNFIKTVLSRHGYRVIPASNGVEALRAAEQYAGPIHLLLTDVVMPQMGGYDLAIALYKQVPDLRVLYVSGYADSARREAHENGCVHAFLHKPFVQSTLLAGVRNILDRKD